MLRTRLIAGPVTALVLSAAFAVVMTLVAKIDVLFEPLRVEPARPAPVTLRLPPTTVVDSDGRLQVRRGVFPRGQRVADPQMARLIRRYEHTRRPPNIEALTGLALLYFLLALMLSAYLRGFSPGRGALLRTQLGLLGLSTALFVGAKAILLLSDLPDLILPVGAIGLWCALYLDRRTALMIGIFMSFILASLVDFRLTSLSVYLASALLAPVVFRERKRTATLLLAGLFGGVAAGIVYLAASFVFEGGVDPMADILLYDRSEILSAVAGGLLAGIVALAFRGAAVLALGAVSRSRLLDLTDLDQPLLVKIRTEAPGSWEHSRAMANLAESAAAAVRADTLLTRVGAYYHDLGKTCQPKYFVENLEPGERSPHEDLDPDVSADAIIAHVVEGTRMLRAGGIPEPVVEFAYTHHGTSVIEYFWHRCLEQGNLKQLKQSFFRYPGMRPRTKETAILMLIDAIEAAARTVQEPTREKFEALVYRIFSAKLRQGQLDQCGLTMRDLKVLTNNITDTLCSVYHNRIRYPWQEKESASASASTSAGASEAATTQRAQDPDRDTVLDLRQDESAVAQERDEHEARGGNGALPIAGREAGDGSAGDGSAGDGSAGDGSAGDGSAGDGSAGDGSAGDGSAGDGSAGDGSAGDEEVGVGAAADGGTGEMAAEVVQIEGAERRSPSEAQDRGGRGGRPPV